MNFLGMLKKCVNDEIEDDEELVLLSDDEVGNPSTRIDYTRLLKILDECLVYTEGFVGDGGMIVESPYTTNFVKCQCEESLVDIYSDKKRYCHKCKPEQTPITPKEFIYGQFVKTTPDGQVKHDCTKLEELNRWLKDKKNVQIGEDAPIVLPKRKSSVKQPAVQGGGVGYKDPAQREVLEGLDLEELERETMKLVAWTFADVRVSYNN